MEEIKLSNEEIARVFALYLGCKIQNNLGDELISYNVGTDGWISGSYADGKSCGNASHFKLLLKPLSSITDEDAIEVAEIIKSIYDDYDFSIGQLREALINERFTVMPYFVFQHLAKKGYSLPLFFGVNHWANGKTAIELDIAIDSSILKQ